MKRFEHLQIILSEGNVHLSPSSLKNLEEQLTKLDIDYFVFNFGTHFRVELSFEEEN